HPGRRWHRSWRSLARSSGRAGLMSSSCPSGRGFAPRFVRTPPLRFASPSAPSVGAEDSHLQAVEHARHTSEGPQLALRPLKISSCGRAALLQGPNLFPRAKLVADASTDQIDIGADPAGAVVASAEASSGGNTNVATVQPAAQEDVLVLHAEDYVPSQPVPAA